MINNKSIQTLLVASLSLLVSCIGPDPVAWEQYQRSQAVQAERQALAFNNRLETALRSYRVVYLVTTNQPCRIVYRWEDGTEITEPSQSEKWFKAFNPTVGQKIQISVRNTDFHVSGITSTISVEVYVDGKRVQKEGAITPDPYFHVVTPWWNWK